MKHEAVRGDGTKIDPGHGVVPIIKEIGRGRLKIVGTGFYITRYGLFMTARHVLEELLTKTKEKIGVGFVLHLAGDDKIHLRRILSGAFLNPADLAVGQAENYRAKFPDNPLMNIRPTLTGAIPPEGSDLATYAYPENDVLDFTQKDKPPMVSSDFFMGSS